MNQVRLIAREELRLLWRNRVATVALFLLLLLTLAAVLTSWSHQRSIAELRARHQAAAEHAFDAQPNRHPHRVVHYGTFIYRPLSPLAAFDPGVDAFTGNSMFLEGHRQNTANFGDVRQSSLLVRFGQLTPAFVLQIVAPLLLIFLGYGMIARERERGTLRLLMLQGVTRGQIVRGKIAALGIVALLIGFPAMLGLFLIAGQPGALALPMLTVAAGYTLYLMLWVIITALISTVALRSRDALLSLLAIWAVMAILLPRVAPDIARASVPLDNRLQTDVAIARELRKMGDSHNPDDPHFAAFQQSILQRYGVSRLEDLPVNYNGLLALEGERLSSELFDRYAAQSHAAQERQNSIVATAALISPTIALQNLSMNAAGTDYTAHQQFLDQAEAYRFALVQKLNQLQADDVSYADDNANDAGADQRRRINAANWQSMPDFHFQRPGDASLVRAALPGLGLLMGWLALVSVLLWRATRRLGAS